MVSTKMIEIKSTSGARDNAGWWWKAGMMECPHCNSNSFSVIWLEGQDHHHYQCVQCGETFCGTFNDTQCKEVPPAGKTWVITTIDANGSEVRKFGPRDAPWEQYFEEDEARARLVEVQRAFDNTGFEDILGYKTLTERGYKPRLTFGPPDLN